MRDARLRPLAAEAVNAHTLSVVFYALVSTHSTLAVEVYVTREAAEADLGKVLADEPGFADILDIVEIDFAPESANALHALCRSRPEG